MSVLVFSDHELEALWGALDPTAADANIGHSLVVLGVANRAAYMLSYNEPVEPVKIEAPRAIGVPEWARNLDAWLSNLLYNCVSNGGTDFAPVEHVDRVKKAAAARRAVSRPRPD